MSGTDSPLRIGFHSGHDGEPGVEAWALDRIGLATWATDEEALLRRLPDKITEHFAWLARHRLASTGAPDQFEIVERVTGDEVLLASDLCAATPEEIDETIALLRASRADLLATLEGASDAVLDWDPPYESFAEWENWPTIRATLAHVANGETHYYLKSVGHEPVLPPIPPDVADWRSALAGMRDEATGFLAALRGASDLDRVGSVDFGHGAERWSVRKALRRIVRHELTHWKSIRRIRGAFDAAGREGAPLR